MRRHVHRPTHAPHRSGLAPLELTLALPLLLMMLALMILMGTAGAWKVRASANARQALLRSIYPRTTDDDPKPKSWWPASAEMEYVGGGNSPFNSDPFEEHEAVRGPTIADPGSGAQLRVLIDTLDMRQGMRSGEARIDHKPAMWPGLGTRNAFTVQNVAFAGQTWQYGNMGIPFNTRRRILYTYDYELSKYNPGAAARVMAARGAILSNPHRPALAVLDRDQELRAHYGGWIDFHPGPNSLCTNDPEELRSDVLLPLLRRIEDVPRRMAQTFLSMYRQQLQDLQNMAPPPPDFGSRMADLEEKIRQLEAFLQTL